MSTTKSYDLIFFKIKIDEFLSGTQINHPIYIQLGKDKFVKISFSAEELAQSRIESLIAKGVKYLYLRDKDFTDYLEFNRTIALTMLKSKKI